MLSNANENWYIILYELFSRLCYIATCGPFCKDATLIRHFSTISSYIGFIETIGVYILQDWPLAFMVLLLGQ